MRLDKLLSDSGYGSRKEVKNLIKSKNVAVNGEIERDGARIIDENIDEVLVLGKPIIYEKNLYILLNKPKGYLSATKDPPAPVVTDLVELDGKRSIFPVGRLDKDTTGTMLLTDDGKMAHSLLSPKKHVDKTYYVETDIPILDINLAKNIFSEGIEMDGKKTLPAKLEVKGEREYLVTIREGKYHQVKRMFSYLGCEIIKLDRVSFAFLNCEGLSSGQWRFLKEEEILKLKELC